VFVLRSIENTHCCVNIELGMFKFVDTLGIKGLKYWRTLPPVFLPTYHARTYRSDRFCSDDRGYVQRISVTFEYHDWQ